MAAAPSTDASFRALFDAHHKSVQAYCLRRLPTEDANEAASEVFVVAWRRIDELPQGEETLLWLYGVARNVVRNRQRGARRYRRLVNRSVSMGALPTDEPETQVIRNEEHERVRRALSMLSEPDRALLGLKVWEGLSNEAVGRILGISHRAVEGRYARAIKRLSRRLGRGSWTGTRSPLSADTGEIPR